MEDYGKWMRDNISQCMEYSRYTFDMIDETLENSRKYWAGELPKSPKTPTLKEIRLKKLKNIEKNSKK